MGSAGGDGTRLLHVSDTHLGYAPYGSDARRRDFSAAFTQVVDVACERAVDAVVHTGDMTHDAMPSGALPESAWQALRRLSEHEIPFYFVLGNHDITDEGRPQQWVEELVEAGLGHRLGSHCTTVGNATLYGVDYRPASWRTEPTLEFEPAPAGNTRLLCLHQSLAPVAPGSDGVELETIRQAASIPFGAVLVGHSHYTRAADVDGTRVFYAGASERTTRAYDEEPTVVSELAIGADIERTTHDIDTRAFGTYTVVPGNDDSPESLFEGRIEGEVVTIFYPAGTTDATRLEAAAEAAGAIDAKAHETSKQVTLAPGVYEGTPDDLSTVGAWDERARERAGSGADTEQSRDHDADASTDNGADQTVNTTTEDRTASSRAAGEPTVLHAGALYIGAANLSIDRRADFQRSLSQVVERAIDEDVTAVVQSGTFFGTGSPPSYTLERCRETLTRLDAAGIPFLHAGSERDRRMEEFETLVEEGLITRLGSEPVLVGETAVYGLDPGDGATYSTGVGSLEERPSEAEHAIVGGTVAVSPPLSADGADLDAAEVRAELPVDVDALLLGGGERRSIEQGDPDICYAGPTERMLYQSAFDERPDYPCSVSRYRLSDGAYDEFELEYRTVHPYEFDVTPGTPLEDITGTLAADLEDSTVMVRLTGRSAEDDFDAAELEAWLEERAAIVKVYDKRVVAERADSSEETADAPPSGDSASESESPTSDDDTDSDVSGGDVPNDGESTPDEGDHAVTEASERGPATGTESEPDPPVTDVSDELIEEQSADGVDPSVSPDAVTAELFPDAGSDLDPDAHLAGAQLLEAGFAEVRPTTDDTCGYVFHASDFASATDQRRGVAHRDLDGGEWHCPHPAPNGDRCPFHAPVSATDTDIEAALLERLASDDPDAGRFIGATFPGLSLTYEDLPAGAHSLVDFTHAHFAGDVRLEDVTIGPEVRFDGVSIDGGLSAKNSTFERKFRLRGAHFEDGLSMKWTRFGGIVAFAGAMFGDDIRFQNCEFETASFSNATYRGDLTLLKSHFRGEVYFYHVDVHGQLDCNRASFGSELRFEDALLRGGTDFEEASFADLLVLDGGFAGGPFGLNDAVASHRVQLESLVTPTLDCSNLRADGRVDVLGAEVGEVRTRGGVFADDVRIAGVEAESFDLERTKLQRDLRLIESRIERDLDTTGVTVGGVVEFVRLSVGGAISLVNARIEGALSVVGPVPTVTAQGVRVDGNVTFKTDDDAGPLSAPGGSFGDRVEFVGPGEWVGIQVPNASFDGLVTIDTDVAGDVEAHDAVFTDATVVSGRIEGALALRRARFTERPAITETTVEGTLSLVGARLERGIAVDSATLGTLDAAGATCTGSIEVIKSQLTDGLTFTDATATGTVEVSGGTLGGFDASEAVFEDTVKFRTDVDGPLQLAQTRFDGHVRFDGITVAGPVSLEELRAVRLGFSDVGFEAEVDASRATFERRARFTNSTIEGVATFAQADFDGGVTFEGCEFRTGGSFDGCRIAGRADFTDMRFAKEPSFANAIVAEAIFDGLGSLDETLLPVDCTGATIDGGRIVQPQGGTCYDFTDARLGSIRLDFSGEGLDRYRFYRTEFDGFQFSDHAELAAADWRIHDYVSEGQTTPEGLETTYRRAKNGASQVGDSDAEGHFFRQEMRQRKASYEASGKRWNAYVNEVYRRSSGYGEHPGTVIKSSIYAVLAFAVLLPVTKALALLVGGTSPGSTADQLLAGQLLEAPYGGPFGWLLLSVESFTTLVHGGTTVVHPWVRGVGAFEGFFGAFFIALFLFTLTKAIDR